jgi:hypothetical protein
VKASERNQTFVFNIKSIEFQVIEFKFCCQFAAVSIWKFSTLCAYYYYYSPESGDSSNQEWDEDENQSAIDTMVLLLYKTPNHRSVSSIYRFISRRE